MTLSSGKINGGTGDLSGDDGVVVTDKTVFSMTDGAITGGNSTTEGGWGLDLFD